MILQERVLLNASRTQNVKQPKSTKGTGLGTVARYDPSPSNLRRRGTPLSTPTRFVRLKMLDQSQAQWAASKVCSMLLLLRANPLQLMGLQGV